MHTSSYGYSGGIQIDVGARVAEPSERCACNRDVDFDFFLNPRMCKCVTLPHRCVLVLRICTSPPLSRARLSPGVVCDRDVECVYATTLRPSWRALNLYRFPFPRPICCSISGAAPCKHATPPPFPTSYPFPPSLRLSQCNAISPINSSGFSQRGALA